MASRQLRTLPLVTLLFFVLFSFGQNIREKVQQKESFIVSATEVVVDVIVNDKNNRMVKDLGPSDFEIYEDGVKQTIQSVQLVQREAVSVIEPKPAANPAGPSGSDQPSASRRIAPPLMMNPVALIFDNLTLRPENRVFVRRAARDYIEKIAENDRLAVFGVDTQLFLVQTFSNDKKALQDAVDQVIDGNSREFGLSGQSFEAKRREERAIKQGIPLSAMGRTQALSTLDAAGIIAGADVGFPVDAVLRDVFSSFYAFEREVQTKANVLALLSIVRGLQQLPGRKSVIFFSEGSSLPTSVVGAFESVIGAANRSGVAFYTIDAAGLRLTTAANRAVIGLRALRNARLAGVDPTIVRGGQSTLGQAESLTRSNAESVLAELARSTGGVAIHNTNDLRSGLKRIDEDMRSYYLLTYAPTNRTFDGKFRNTQVKVGRPGVKVRSRSGYFALNTMDSSPIFHFERPLLDLIFAATPPRDFALKLVAMHFPTASGAVSVPIVAEIPAQIVSFEDAQLPSDRAEKGAQQKPTYVGQLAVLVLVTDAEGVVVKKLSQDYRLGYTSEREDDVRNSTLTFYRRIQLPAGNYQVKAVARDAGSARASVTSFPLTIAKSSNPTLRLSSIVPTSGAAPLIAGQEDTDNPFLFDQVSITPNLDQRFLKSDEQMMFYFTVQTKPHASVKAKVEFLQAGQVLAQAPGTLPAADATGRIQFVASFPLDPFPVGDYQVRVTVDDGSVEVSGQTSFKVSE